MHTATYFTFGPDQAEARRLNRVIGWSTAAHVAVIGALLVLPRSWFGPEEAAPVMRISLGGTPGPRSTGTTSIGGQTVERVAPPPPRPEPVRPSAPVQKPAASVVKPQPKPIPPPTATNPAPAPTRAPAAGAQVVAGNSPVETGARGQGAGLTFGGGGSGGETDLSTFCCQEYLQQLLAAVESRWAKSQSGRGTTILRFTIRRDGSIDAVGSTVIQSSGNSIQDRSARAAIYDARLMPLPAAYPNPELTIRLSFPYGPQ